MLIATGLTTEHWIVLPVAIIIFAVGNGDSRAQRGEAIARRVWTGVRRLSPARARGHPRVLLRTLCELPDRRNRPRLADFTVGCEQGQTFDQGSGANDAIGRILGIRGGQRKCLHANAACHG
jgi:hypothetical protein